MIKPINLLVTLFALLFTFSCATETPITTQPVPPQIDPKTVQYQWDLIGIDGQPLGLGIRSGLKISSTNKATGNLACNHFFGTIEFRDNTLKIDKIGSTRQICQDNVMSIERMVSTTLGQWSEVLINGDRLTLVGKSHRLNYQRK